MEGTDERTNAQLGKTSVRQWADPRQVWVLHPPTVRPILKQGMHGEVVVGTHHPRTGPDPRKSNQNGQRRHRKPQEGSPQVRATHEPRYTRGTRVLMLVRTS